MDFDFDLGSSSVDYNNMAPVRKRLESESESPPSLEPSSDVSASSDENYHDPAPATTPSLTSAKKLRFSSYLENLTSCGGSNNDRDELKVTTTDVNELQPTKQEKQVRFDSCTVRFMPLIAGDHPDCVEGPPVRSIVLTITAGTTTDFLLLCSNY
jgi:hypothetical protein